MASNPLPDTTGRYGEIFDRGYAHYDGPRRGRRGAITSLIGYSAKRAMGIRKSWVAKLMPIFLYLVISIPLVVMIGISAIVPQLTFASYSNYFSGVFFVVGLFVALCAPEMICVDRQERTLPLYFSRAIYRRDYVLAKIVAMTLLTLTMTSLPGFLLWFGRQLTADKVRQAMIDNSGDLWRVLFLGLMISLMLGTLGLAISSFFRRKGVAILLILVGFLVLSGISQGLSTALQDYSWSRWILLGDLTTVVATLAARLFPHEAVSNSQVDVAGFSMEAVLLYMLALIIVSVLILIWRYQPSDDV